MTCMAWNFQGKDWGEISRLAKKKRVRERFGAILDPKTESFLHIFAQDGIFGVKCEENLSNLQ
eukprot:c383_g1_i1 orf=220-408(+)